MHRMYGFRNCSSPYVINSNLYIRILVTVRCFHSCRHIPNSSISNPIPPVQNTCVGGIKSLFITSLRFCWIPKHFAPRPLSFPSLSCSLTLKKAGNLLDAFCLCRHIPFLYYLYYIFFPCSLGVFF